VKNTVVGYCGGSTADPSYKVIGDHTEAIAIEFDSAVITYETLLKKFWAMHTPGAARRQYRSAVFVQGEDQLREATAMRLQQMDKHALFKNTAVEPLCTFYEAEEYHQNYVAKNRRF